MIQANGPYLIIWVGIQSLSSLKLNRIFFQFQLLFIQFLPFFFNLSPLFILYFTKSRKIKLPGKLMPGGPGENFNIKPYKTHAIASCFPASNTVNFPKLCGGKINQTGDDKTLEKHYTQHTNIPNRVTASFQILLINFYQVFFLF